MNGFSFFFIAALVLMTVVELWLSLRQSRHVSAHRDKVPDAFKEQISTEDHQKAANYTVAKGKLNRLDGVLGMVVLSLWTFGGGLVVLSGFWQSFGWSDITAGVFFILSFFILSSVIDLPLSWYRTFVLEADFGFNKVSGGLFFSDFLFCRF